MSFSEVGLDWCEGKMPVPDGQINVRWWTEGGKIMYRADVPAGYLLKVENLTGRQLSRGL
ncbi:MAG: alpha-L-rhamnosidase C-terminal domain-containing protein [Planctomycetota bacterium]